MLSVNVFTTADACAWRSLASSLLLKHTFDISMNDVCIVDRFETFG